MAGPVLDLCDVSYHWPGRAGFALTVPSFHIAKGETVLLLGESGSGKSTLLSLICGTILPDRGTVNIAGRNIAALSGGARDRFRAEHIGVIFQQFNLLPFGSVADNILLPLRFAPARRKRVQDAAANAADLCTALGLPADIMTAKASALSVGQQQRVAVARALIGQPPLIIADEPTSALDANSQAAFLDLLFAQTRTNETSLLMVSHDPRLGARFDRVIQMEEIAQTERTVA
ncbi:putative ABC transport system ATP-binding protein [Sulfitobacter marinus]|uniref:Putative ABC transport system ATP-binding protein n=1 Tax=Sulfitobacter marinus TaxID=394264 RepID=A0A1I6QZ21_9RHOB|nr:ABC transporter ATP-binding protein [Sulfitobacter marinus]SFS57654.1 putative ABC transport system ATP-binding protein [Sulfitobacter marinus]